MEITLREVTGLDELHRLYPLIRQLNPELAEAHFRELCAHMLPLGYRCVVAYEGERMVGACGFWTRCQFWNDRSLQLDNLVVDEACRSRRIGQKLMQWVEDRARREHCRMLVLDSYVHNHPSHKLYFREGYIIRGYHFTKDL